MRSRDHHQSRKKTKAMVQNRKTRRSGRRTINDRDIEVVRSFRYLETVIRSTNDETEEIGTGILASDRASYCMHTVWV